LRPLPLFSVGRVHWLVHPLAAAAGYGYGNGGGSTGRSRLPIGGMCRWRICPAAETVLREPFSLF